MDIPEYNVVLLPKTLNKFLIRKFAALNLEAIRAIYNRVLQHSRQYLRGIESWEDQLKDPNYLCLILLAPNINTGALSLDEAQWIGMFVLRGPLDAKAYNYFNLDTIQPHPDGKETRWLGIKLYVKEQHRNIEAMRLLWQACMNHMKRETKSKYGVVAGQSAVARLQSSAFIGTTSHNYHCTMGARVVAELTQTQDLAYDGYLDQVPPEFLDDKSMESVSTVFEYVFEYTLDES